MSNEEYQAVKHFAEGLKTCITTIRKNSVITETAEAALDYVLSLISLHLSIAEVELQHTAEDMEKKILDKYLKSVNLKEADDLNRE
jgi:hypothetical protein